jgi:hypothetical protein
MLFQTLSASDDFGSDRFTGKYNIIHYISLRPVENLELGFIQTMLWGNRFEFLYLVPFSFLFASESITGFEDNAFMGLHMRWRPFNSLLVNGQIYVDDFHFNNFLSGSIEAKAAAEAGISWTPKKGFLSKLDFDYTAVLPYCYTHWMRPDANRFNGFEGSGTVNDAMNPGHEKRIPNYLNYTHLGKNLGPDLEPNSDRISLRTNWNIIPAIDILMSAYYIRHGNASDGKEGMDANFHDGSIFDDGCLDPWIPGTPDYPQKGHNKISSFLAQDLLEMRLGSGLGLAWTIPGPIGTFRLSAEYGAEYGWNRSSGQDKRPLKGNNGLDHFWSFGGMWSW